MPRTPGQVDTGSTNTWDAEGRLVRVEPTPGQYPPPDGARNVESGCDYLGRRTDKRVYDWVGPGPNDWAATSAVRRKFVWSGWLMLLEL